MGDKREMRLLRLVAANAYVLCVLYLLTGLVLEGLRRLAPIGPLQWLSLSLDSLPARALARLGALGPVREAYLSGQLGEAGVRLVFSATTMLIICLLAVAVGLLTALLRGLVTRVRHDEA